MKLIADSGSTKTAWLLTGNPHTDIAVTTGGINPVRDSEQEIATLLDEQLMPAIGARQETVTEVWFYGAGCIDPFRAAVQVQLERLFPQAQVHVESDLLGAARALCGHQPGIACILGTGSNSCLYDGQQITHNVSPLGFILGDEGSGAVLGRLLVGDLLKGQMGEQLRQEFLQRFQLTPADIISHVYRQPQPNRFLASLVPFIVEHQEEDCMQLLLVDSFRSFFRRNVLQYGHPEWPVHFVGGIACQFQHQLQVAAQAEGCKVGQILAAPIAQMARYHCE